MGSNNLSCRPAAEVHAELVRQRASHLTFVAANFPVDGVMFRAHDQKLPVESCPGCQRIITLEWMLGLRASSVVTDLEADKLAGLRESQEYRISQQMPETARINNPHWE